MSECVCLCVCKGRKGEVCVTEISIEEKKWKSNNKKTKDGKESEGKK